MNKDAEMYHAALDILSNRIDQLDLADDELAHEGRKGMKWYKNIFGKDEKKKKSNSGSPLLNLKKEQMLRNVQKWDDEVRNSQLNGHNRTESMEKGMTSPVPNDLRNNSAYSGVLQGKSNSYLTNNRGMNVGPDLYGEDAEVIKRTYDKDTGNTKHDHIANLTRNLHNPYINEAEYSAKKKEEYMSENPQEKKSWNPFTNSKNKKQKQAETDEIHQQGQEVREQQKKERTTNAVNDYIQSEQATNEIVNAVSKPMCDDLYLTAMQYGIGTKEYQAKAQAWDNNVAQGICDYYAQNGIDVTIEDMNECLANGMQHDDPSVVAATTLFVNAESQMIDNLADEFAKSPEKTFQTFGNELKKQNSNRKPNKE